MKISCEHIASNCNPMPSSFSFLTNDIIAYCYKNQIGLYNLSTSHAFRNIHQNTEQKANRANCIKTFSKNNQYFIAVGYDNGQLIIYQSKDTKNWQIGIKVTQANSILHLNIEQEFIAVGNNDALVTIYQFQYQNDTITLKPIQDIQFPLIKTIESVAMKKTNEQLIIFLGGVDQKIHCYTNYLKDLSEQGKYYFSLSGHENSITKLAIIQESDYFLLASSSKDGYIRLWKITQNQSYIKFHKNVKTLEKYKIFLDSVLISHQCSVTSVFWTNFNKRQLLSSSLDCTVCVWGQSEEDGTWTVETRMGQFLGNKNAYFDIMANQAGTQLVALNYIGSLLIWDYNKQINKFTLRDSFNGHYSQVKDIAWNHSGDFLVSVSKDQTTRVIAQNKATSRYHEISRAQIHGYDINTVCLLKTKDETLDILVCGADQKVIRIFQPPACFANYFNSFTRKNFHLFFDSVEDEKKYLLPKQKQDSPLLYETYTEGGAQVLGLMTKNHRVEREKVVNYYDDEEEEEQMVEDEKIDLKDSKRIDFDKPPHDDYLVKHTLWPQMNKLYGHPHQIQYVCRSHDSKKLASSCKGLTKQASSIIIWSTQTWKVLCILSHHAYTVYYMQFSVLGNYFTSVSKDRKLAVFNSNDPLMPLLFSYQAHSRAITSVSISSDQSYIITGSRDKTIKLHSIKEQKVINSYQFKVGVTAVAFCHLKGKERYVAVGLVDGWTGIMSFDELGNFELLQQVQQRYSHTEKVNAIRWNNDTFATCSDDHSLAIFKVEF